MAKKKVDETKKDVVKKTTQTGQEENEKTVIGIIEAEKLQKSGWQLISAVRTSDDPFGDKEYKFRKE